MNPATIETLSVVIAGLEEYNNYTIRVSAVNEIGASPFSDEIIQITDIAGLIVCLILCYLNSVFNSIPILLF